MTDTFQKFNAGATTGRSQATGDPAMIQYCRHHRSRHILQSQSEMNPLYPYDAYGYDPYYTADLSDWESQSQPVGSYQPQNTCNGYSYYVPHLAHKPPISALALHNSDALFVAGHCVREAPKPKAAGLISSFSSMAVHSFPEGTLYSACAAHAEAPSHVLNALASSIFGGTVSSSSNTSNNPNPRGRFQNSISVRVPPAHAYRPCYGFGESSTTPTMAVSSSIHFGINTIVPFSNNTVHGSHTLSEQQQQHFACTISPSSVRLHTMGGLQISSSSSLRGMVSGTLNPIPTFTQAWDSSMATHITVGGIYIRPEETSSSTTGPHLHCLDLYSHGLPTVSSCTLKPHEEESASTSATATTAASSLCITKLATLHDRNTMVAGCSDGTIRILDGGWRSKNIEAAKMKAHSGGVTDISVQGNLICTCGYNSRGGVFSSVSTTTGIDPLPNTSSYYAFPDPNIYIFDLRYLGRGGLAHPFRGYKGGPRFVAFLDAIPEDDNTGYSGDGRILVASGQSGGGLEIITPFKSLQEDHQSTGIDPAASFLQPDLESTSETITCIVTQGLDLVVGSSLGNVLQYKRLSTMSDLPSVKNRVTLSIPSLIPEPPILPIDPFLLLKNYEDLEEHREGNLHTQYAPLRCKSIFNTYITDHDQLQLSRFGYDSSNHMSSYQSFGPLSEKPLVTQGKRLLSKKLQELCALNVATDNDFLCSIPISQMGIEVLPSSAANSSKKKTSRANPNKLLYAHHFRNVCYNDADPRKGKQGKKSNGSVHRVPVEDDGEIPRRYSLKNAFRPTHSVFSAQDYASINQSLFPGCDYAPFRPNAFFPSILLFLYFTPDVRHGIESHQYELFNGGGNDNLLQKTSLITELGFLFHQIESISSHAHVYPAWSEVRPILSAFVPTTLLSTLSISSEVLALALLDGSPAAVEHARRPEAFYRFLIHHLDKELPSPKGPSVAYSSIATACENGKLIDCLQGIDFISVSAVAHDTAIGMGRSSTDYARKKGPTGRPKVSQVRSLSVEMAYEPFTQFSDGEGPDFGKVLAYSLCKVVKLRAWNTQSKSFETIAQGKAITTLPKALCITCACSGNQNNDGLVVWRQSADQDPWLPEIIEIEIIGFGHVRVWQVVNDTLKEFDSELIGLDTKSAKVFPDIDETIQVSKVRKRYRLDAVLSFVHDESEKDFGIEGHHVLHARVPNIYRKKILMKQLEKVKQASLIPSNTDSNTCFRSLGSISQDEWNRRERFIQSQLIDCDKDEWLLFNGIMVSSSSSIDARAFDNDFKEPCILYYQEISLDGTSARSSPAHQEYEQDSQEQAKLDEYFIPPTRSFLHSDDLPGCNDLIAFDAEFVQVQQEYFSHTTSGQKKLIHEGRNALARISLIDCQSGQVLCDEHVIPLEPVTDYLTRFSGIRPGDLNPQTSAFPLISHRAAYLKMRTLVERGCIFVGHGLSQDFSALNLFVPPAQIIDTLLIYHLENRRYISLRFLVNFFLERDMQQETHDSIEDSKSAFDLYQLAVKLTKEGQFKKKLIELYDYGERIDWKIGVLNR